MNFLTIAEVAAQNGQAAKPNSLITFLPFIVIIAAMFFMTSRSQKKQAAKRAEMLSKIVKGTEVILANGIYGKIVEVADKSYLVEIAPNVVIKVVDAGIANLTEVEAAAK